MDDNTPKTLREKALDYVERLINGDDADGNPLRLEAARMVIENYWSFDHENDGDVDFTAGARKLDVEMWNNAAPGQLKVKQSYTTPALTEFGDKCPIEPKPTQSGTYSKPSPHTLPPPLTAKDYEPDPTIHSARIKDLDCSTPVARCLRCGEICTESIEVLCKVCSDRKKEYLHAFWNSDGPFALKAPMTLGRAVEVLNEKHYDTGGWEIRYDFATNVDKTYDKFEAIAIAEKLEREK